MNADDDVARQLWFAIAAVGGSITSLAFRAWQKMTPGEMGMAVFASAAFAFFVVPAVGKVWWGIPFADLSIACGAVFLGAVVAPIAIPAINRRTARWIDSRKLPGEEETGS